MEAPIPPTLPATARRTPARSLESYFHLPGTPRMQSIMYFIYYLGIIIALLLIYGRGDFTTAPFVYQGF